ncbi:Na(+)/H(+) exchange regulatory cofactor NHE-RF2-like [Conger conger]|uniref:Na(+)/H(+) exchange regulatory cofactor NHE-RF2-like n=1 Tax=Conger conger TaxID=82655 RepID=UPI002A5A7D2D|nr:Na(+)/H(+) exchange regulatory cofactor NHE-RF2-like [Conger conger]
MESELKPRLCVMLKGENGYGFHLHGEKGKSGQYIRKVEPDSPAEASGLRAGDRVVEVNGESVEKETHHQVVQRIKAVEQETRLLVVDRDTDEYLRSLRLTCTEDMAVQGKAEYPASTPSKGENGSVSKPPRTPSPKLPRTPSPKLPRTPSPKVARTPSPERPKPTKRSPSRAEKKVGALAPPKGIAMG